MTALATVVGYVVLGVWAFLAGILLVAEVVATVRAGRRPREAPYRVRAPNGEGYVRYSTVEEITR